MEDVSCSKVGTGSRSVSYLLNLIFAQSPQQFKNTLQNAFSTISQVLLRQRQLAETKFICDDNRQHVPELQNPAFIENLCSKLSLKREEVDPDRLIWLPVEILAKYLIRPGQWIILRQYGRVTQGDFKSEGQCEDVFEFKCQIFPLPISKNVVTTPTTQVHFFMNPVTEYNLRKALNIHSFMPLPPLRIQPLLSDPLVKTGNQSLSFSPIRGKSVKLTRVKAPTLINLRELDIMLEDAFAMNCKYLCVGDIISLRPSSNSSFSIDLVVSEINDKKLNDSHSYKEVFKVSKDNSRVLLNSFEAYNQFHVPSRIENGTPEKTLAPCLAPLFQKINGWVRQALIYNLIKKTNSNKLITEETRYPCSDLWPNILTYGPVGTGKFTVIQTLASSLGLNFYFINGVNLIGDTSAYTEGKLKAIYDKVSNALCPAIVYIKNLHVVGKDKDGNEDKRVILAFKEFLRDFANLSTDSNLLSPTERKSSMAMTSRAVFIIGSTEYPEKLVPALSQMFIFKLEFPSIVNSICDFSSTLKWFLDKGGVDLEEKIDLDEWASNYCKGMQRSFGDLKALAATIVRNAFTRTNRKSSGDLAIKINLQDLKEGLSTIDKVLKKAASTVEVPQVNWEDIGGLEDIKKELIDSVKLPLEFPHLFSSGVRRSGILLYGPPGTGKTLIAKAVATEFKLSFLSVKGPELLNMYVGQSEQNVRDVFAKARGASPCIIFFDELDALAPNRGRAGDSGGVMDRVVSQILAELDGTHSTPGVFVIGATNRPDLIDPALLRPGRFDKLLYVGVSEDDKSRTSILKALTRKFHLGEDVDLMEVSSQLPKGMSGADLYSLCSDAYMTAIERNISLMSENKQDLLSGVLVKKCDFKKAISRVIPSLSKLDQDKYESLKRMKR